jgi:hypothetical protein
MEDWDLQLPLAVLAINKAASTRCESPPILNPSTPAEVGSVGSAFQRHWS